MVTAVAKHEIQLIKDRKTRGFIHGPPTSNKKILLQYRHSGALFESHLFGQDRYKKTCADRTYL